MVNYSQPVGHILVIEDEQYRRTISLEESSYSIGRDSKNTIIISSPKISRKHATLLRRHDPKKKNQHSYWILDGDLEGQKSLNGIHVNGEKCVARELKHGDLINLSKNVNATYYEMTNWSDTLVNLTQNKTINSEENISKSTSPNQLGQSETAIKRFKSTLSSSESIIDNLHIKDTVIADSCHDNLTELPNQNLFREYISIALKNAMRNQNLMAVAFVHFENFKAINDKLGCQIGDQLLQYYAKRLSGCFRAGDIVGRWGSDEFGILLPKISNIEDIVRIKQRIMTNLQQPFDIAGNQLYLNSSLGLALYPQDGQTIDILLTKAKGDLFFNQQKNKNQTNLELNNKNSKSVQIIKTKKVLEQALAREEFFLQYQPQVKIHTGEICGMEALVRWQHPRLGIIPPNQFIKVAEETDFMTAIGQWVLKTACLQSQVWQQAGFIPIPISVNLSPRQLQDPNLASMVAQVLEETNLSPHLLELEVTETGILQNIELARHTLSALEKIGVHLAMDDFGTGYSALAQLKQFTFHSLKIAQAFVSHLTDNPQDIALISALIAWGRSLNLRIIAEGVENQQQLELLYSLECEEMQGYRFSKPLTSEEAFQFLSAHHLKK
jgi:diguanylate cyclase (GGDEF)-like protein